MKKTFYILFLCANLLVIVSGQNEYFSRNALERHIQVLGSDSLLGRGTGNSGGEQAAQYIAVQLASMGLKPFGDNGGYFQKLQVHENQVLPSSVLNYISSQDTIIFEYLKDYVMLKYGSQTYIPQPSELVFVGYGITAPEYDYNDYQAINVQNKIVVYLEGEPYSDDSTFFAGSKPSVYSYPEAKERNAIAHGARGSIMIAASPDQGGKSWKDWQQSYAFPDMALAYSVAGHFSTIIPKKTASRIFQSSSYSMQEIYQMKAENRILSFPLNGKVSFLGAFDQRDFMASNVLAIRKGRQKNDSYLIVSAHYDHLGVGPAVQGDSIYNGVVDNALGVSGLLQLAHAIAKNQRPKRSIIFLFVTGEEKGLLGTKYYLDHPQVPLYKTIANINIDGLAMFDEFESIIGIGSQYSTLRKFLKESAESRGVQLSTLPDNFSGPESFLRSDQAGFAREGIPSILIMDGPHYENLSYEEGMRKHTNWIKNRYHTPFDDFEQPLNYDAMQQHCALLFDFIINLANRDEEPVWNSNSPYINARLRSKAEKR
ncbi:MAG: M28 family peptidase [Candidatus Marinimicrobia bacterium]|nr:M28 family peptidase [Candidatus Neomarinimicrobiota bacterium]